MTFLQGAKYLLRRSRAASVNARLFSTSSTANAVYGFIGLGRMGYPMAGNLRAKLSPTDKLVVHDVNLDVTAKFKQEHEGDVEVAADVRQVAEQSRCVLARADTVQQVVITVLPEPSHVKAVFAAMLDSSSPPARGQDSGRMFIDCSTIDPKTSAEVAEACSSQGQFVDAPMSGGTVAASSGQLTFMIGCDERLVSPVTRILSMMGKRVLHLGPPTSGLKGKLANNYLLAINNIATAEAMNMGISWGLDPKALADMINTSTGRCWPSEVNNPVPGVNKTAPAGRGYVGGFGTPLMNKDLKLAMKAAEEAGIEPRLGPVASDIYKNVDADLKHKGKDFSVVYQWLNGSK